MKHLEHVDAEQRLLLRLLFDRDLRARFLGDRRAVLNESGLSPAARSRFQELDGAGLSLDAELRERYLMSALCRGFPLTCAALGSLPEGDAALARFLAAPAVFAPLGQRTAAFADHLSRLIELDPWGLPPVVLDLLRSLLALERGLTDNAARIREAVARRERVAGPTSWSNSQLKKGRVALPSFFLAVQLPQPSALVAAALSQVGPGDAWRLISHRVLSFDRLVTLARADAVPVTILCRGLARGHGIERAGAGGVAPVVEVSHLRAELAGRQGDLLALFDGRRQLKQLPQGVQRLARELLKAGLLTLEF